MTRIREHRPLVYSVAAFEDILGGLRTEHRLPLVGEVGYPELLAHLLNALSTFDVLNLSELYPTVSTELWRNVCDYGNQAYFQPFTRQGVLTFERLEGSLVKLRWGVEQHVDVRENLEDALTEALSDGMRLRDIVELTKQIEEKMWHEQ